MISGSSEQVNNLSVFCFEWYPAVILKKLIPCWYFVLKWYPSVVKKRITWCFFVLNDIWLQIRCQFLENVGKLCCYRRWEPLGPVLPKLRAIGLWWGHVEHVRVENMLDVTFVKPKNGNLVKKQSKWFFISDFFCFSTQNFVFISVNI
jgi:hypothetical protein